MGRAFVYLFWEGPFYFNFLAWCAACRILVPWPGIEPAHLAEEAWSLNHWTAMEVPLFWEGLFKWKNSNFPAGLIYYVFPFFGSSLWMEFQTHWQGLFLETIGKRKKKINTHLKAEMGRSDSRHLDCHSLPQRKIIYLLPTIKYILCGTLFLKLNFQCSKFIINIST